MAMNGTDILVYVEGTAVGSQRDMSFDETTDVIDASSKDGRPRRVLAGRYSSTISCDALYVPDNAAYIALQTAMRDGTLVTVVRYEDAVAIEQAEAVVAGLSHAGPDQDVATVSITLEIDDEWLEVGT